MQTPKLEAKRFFLIASEDEGLIALYRQYIEKHISNATIFTASDGAEVLFKSENVLPHVVVLDQRLAKITQFAIAERLLTMNDEHSVSIILVSEIPNHELFVNEVVTRQIQFLSNRLDESAFSLCLSRALNRVSLDENSVYRLRFLAPEEVLFSQGDEMQSIFFVKKGTLEVIQEANQKKTILGQVTKSEFVGEMAYFNNDVRSATVRAKNDCELIEIPKDVVDMVLFSKPAWAKALVEALSRRLKSSNTALTNFAQD